MRPSANGNAWTQHGIGNPLTVDASVHHLLPNSGGFEKTFRIRLSSLQLRAFQCQFANVAEARVASTDSSEFLKTDIQIVSIATQ
jgi:hypothetical protein